MLTRALTVPIEIAHALARAAEATADAVHLSRERWHDLLVAVAWNESRFDPQAVSPAGAVGLMQFMEPTWREWGEGERTDPAASALAGARYLAHLVRQHRGDVAAALSAYNWGIGNLARRGQWPATGWRARLPRETRDYLRRIGSLWGVDLLGGGGAQLGGAAVALLLVAVALVAARA